MTIHEVFPYLRVKNATAAIDFYKNAFGVTERFRLTEPGPAARIGHVELDFGTTTVMLSDEYPEYGILAPGPDSPATMSIHLHVDDCDAAIARAVDAGAKLLREPRDQFYGERSGAVRDPFGHEWLIGHEVEKLSPEEMQRRYDAMMKES